MRCINETITSDGSDFGVYCRAWLDGVGKGPESGRRRDLFPLPLMHDVSVPSSCDVDAETIMSTCNLCIIVLNSVWDDCPSVAQKPFVDWCNAAQAKVHGTVLNGVLRMFSRLYNDAAKPRYDGGTAKHPELISSSVEMCPTVCTCDSMAYVSDVLKDIITDGDGFCSWCVWASVAGA